MRWWPTSTGPPSGGLDTPGSLNYYGGRWSPDGTKIVYEAGWVASSEIGNLFVEYLVSGEHRTQVTDFEPVTDTQWFIAPTFSGDGHTVYFHLPRIGSLGFDVWSVPVTGGEPKLLLENAAQPVSIPGQNYWGAFVPAESDTFDGSIVLATRDRSVLVETEGSIDRPSASPDGSKIVFGLERFAGSDMRGHLRRGRFDGRVVEGRPRKHGIVARQRHPRDCRS